MRKDRKICKKKKKKGKDSFWERDEPHQVAVSGRQLEIRVQNGWEVWIEVRNFGIIREGDVKDPRQRLLSSIISIVPKMPCHF